MAPDLPPIQGLLPNSIFVSFSERIHAVGLPGKPDRSIVMYNYDITYSYTHTENTRNSLLLFLNLHT